MTGNQHKKNAHAHKSANRIPYTRARRALDKKRRTRLVAAVGTGSNGRPVTINLSRSDRTPICMITGAAGTGKTALAAQICRSLKAGQQDPDLVLIASTDAHPTLLPKDTQLLTAADIADVITRVLDERDDEISRAAEEFPDKNITDIESYWAAGYAMPWLVLFIDDFPRALSGCPELGQILVPAARMAKTLGVRFLITTQQTNLTRTFWDTKTGSLQLDATIPTFLRLRGFRQFACLEPWHGLVQTYPYVSIRTPHLKQKPDIAFRFEDFGAVPATR